MGIKVKTLLENLKNFVIKNLGENQVETIVRSKVNNLNKKDCTSKIISEGEI